MASNWPQAFTESIRTSQLLRVLLIGFLILILQIPIAMIRGVIREREHTRNKAVEEVTSSWGRAQVLTGPWITVPYRHHWTETRRSGKEGEEESITHTEKRYATFLPETLRVHGTSTTETRYRGIFQVPLYTVALTVSGRFGRPDFSDWGTTDNDILWNQAYMSLGIADTKGITEQAVLSWNGVELVFLPGLGELGGAMPGIHVPLKQTFEDEAFEFSFPLGLNGSESVFFTPLGRETKVELTSDWPHPSFEGNWLPSERTVRADGFGAKWSIPFLGRSYPQQWRTGSDFTGAIEASKVGVKFLVPIDHYRMAYRSIKYAALFVLLTFTTLWLFEILSAVRIHPVQYLLLGAGMSVFYLLELSLAEHIGFRLAYIIASAAIVLLIGSYSVAVLKSPKRASIIGCITAVLYGCLYVVLQSQDYALLIGSLGLFVVIAAIMYLTRRVNWYESKAPLEAPVDE